MKVAIVTGITGQDGSYLAELLLNNNYKVIGLYRRSSSSNFERIEHLLGNSHLVLVEADITDSGCVNQLINDHLPDEVYNLAAQSHVGTSFRQPTYTMDVNIKGPLNFLEAIRLINPTCKFYQASTSEMFGKNYKTLGTTKYQDETTPFVPQSPYGVAKLAAHELVRIYRDSYKLFACCGILFNHESERRGKEFVTRKVTSWIGEYVAWKNSQDISETEYDLDFNVSPDFISVCRKNSDSLVFGAKFPKLRLGNLDAHRDWGHAEDYVKAMYLMLQRQVPEDFVIGTSETYSVREFLDIAFKEVGIDDWSNLVVVDPEFYRPCEVDYLLSKTTKARDLLNWKPSITFTELVQRMVRSDIDATRKKKLERSSLR